MPPDPLALFHPQIAAWFATLGVPTAPQRLAWPRIAAGEHVLVTAPTGTGKTLTAFLWALQQLLTGAWPGSGVRVLYLSPLKALNTDVRRNLLGPLEALQQRFAAAGEACCPVSVAVRSGDTAAAERRRLLHRPPDILITTPESLNLLLASHGGRALFGNLQTVILDEIHAVAGSKRGTHLMLGVERLVPLAGEFQRVALSATVRPLERIARFVGGWRPVGEEWQPRPVSLLRAEGSKRYEVRVEYPSTPLETPDDARWWPEVAAELRTIAQQNRSTLVFCNTRRLCERLTMLVNAEQPAPLAYSHHGSLSRETRAVVEERLKRGELAAIIATGSLELGIDIGALDEVLLVETPREVSSAVQRLGRAGHGVGQTSRGRLYPTFGKDFVHAAVMARCLAEQDIEAIQPIANPLDVLAQVLVAMAGIEPWTVDALYQQIRCCDSYHELPRRQFELVLGMLTGRYANSRYGGLQPRLLHDRLSDTVVARDGALREVWLAGGTIPDRGSYVMRLEGSRAVVGELDEEFVWERRVGEAFVFGTQAWRIESIGANEVLVTPSRKTAMAPFWRGEFQSRSTHFSLRLAEFLEQAAARQEDPTFAAELQRDWFLSAPAADELLDFLQRQRAATRVEVPHRHHLVLEVLDPHDAASDTARILLHTLWGGAVNRPLALCLAAAWEERYGLPAEVFADNDLVLLTPTCDVRPEELLSLVAPGDIEPLLRRRLESSGVFGARFRENAGRALLVTRTQRGQRMPLWLSRLRAKKLLELVSRYDDFPILTETWRTCLQDEFDLPALAARLAEVQAGEVRWSVCHTSSPSGFAGSAIWRQTNHLMYLDDTPTGGPSRLADDLIREAVFSPHLRPALPRELVATFTAKLQRSQPGYPPRSAAELVELVKERWLVPAAEWAALRTAIAADDPDWELAAADSRLAWLTLPNAAAPAVVALDQLAALVAALGVPPAAVAVRGLDAVSEAALPAAWALPSWHDADEDGLPELLAAWLAFYGPLDVDYLGAVWGLDPARRDAALAALAEAQRVVLDNLTVGGPAVEVCDSEHLERLLRLHRRAAQPLFEPQPAPRLGLLLAHRQGLTGRDAGRDGLVPALDALLGYSAPAALWESELLPARLRDYQTAWLDALLQSSDLLWYGTGERQLGFALRPLLDLGRDPQPGAPPLPPGRYSLSELLDQLGGTISDLTTRLWAGVWDGLVQGDSYAAVRTMLRQRAESGRPAAPPRGSRGLRRWQAAQPYAGTWSNLPPPPAEADPLDELEQQKERVRLLLERYGVLCRELLAREVGPLVWSRLFRALRLMELSGELVAGGFISGLPGLQFTTPAVLAQLRCGLPDDAVYWLNATDPASLCGLPLDGLALPERRTSNLLVYHGDRLVILARRGGKELEIRVEPEHQRLPDYLGFLAERQRRDYDPVGTLTIELINGLPADQSPYLPRLRQLHQLAVGFRQIQLWRQPR
ncbi:MAG: DEAD/DEAH box helicase [Fimbriimonadaceae bacterium]|nr:DEAD/DEAH box helicase [Fimbriimonadaceae bacterium]